MSAELATVSFRTESAVVEDEPWTAVDSSVLSKTQARATGQVRHAARQALTEKEFRRRYVDRHQSLYDIAKQTGFSRQTLTRLAAEYGIALREGPQDYKRKGIIDRDWLYEQYVNQGRTLPDLASEKNMSTANMARWAHLYEIPLRPRGGASHGSALRTISQATDLPAPIAKALTSPAAWRVLAEASDICSAECRDTLRQTFGRHHAAAHPSAQPVPDRPVMAIIWPEAFTVCDA